MKPIWLLPVLLFAACAHRAEHYDAPDSTALRQSSARLGQKVTEAKATAARASVAITAAKSSSDRETAILAQIKPSVSVLLRVSPPELKPQVEALDARVQDLDTAHDETEGHIAMGKMEQGALTTQLADAEAAKASVEKLSPEYFTKVDGITAKLNTAEKNWATTDQELHKLKAETWFHRLLGAAAGVAILALIVLWFMGKLTLRGAAVAARILPP